MPKYVRRGSGLTERVVKVPETREEQLAAFEALDAQIPMAQPSDWLGDALMRENAKRCQAMLEYVGLQDMGACVADRQAPEAAGSAEGSAAWIAAHWLATYHHYQRCRARIESGDTSKRNLEAMVFAAHEMGRAQEEMRWRPGIDPETGIAREALALTERDQVKARARGGEETAKLHEPLRESRFRRMAELIPHRGVENAARDCEAEGLGGWQGIKRQWDRFKEKRDT